MKRMLAVLLSLAMVLSFSAPAFAETTLEKINRTGVQPVAFINKNNEWLGFSIDLVEQTIAPEISKKLDNRDYDDAGRRTLLTPARRPPKVALDAAVIRAVSESDPGVTRMGNPLRPISGRLAGRGRARRVRELP